MEIRANDLYHDILEQCKADIDAADVDSRSRVLVEFVDFVLADAASEGVNAVNDILCVEVAPWDEPWVVSEFARSTLDALNALQNLASTVLKKLEDSGETEATKQLCKDLKKAIQSQKLLVKTTKPISQGANV